MTGSRRWHLSLIFVALACPLMTQTVQGQAQDALLEGRWEGLLRVPPSPLEVEITFVATDAGWVGRFSLPAEGIEDVPVASVRVHGDSLIVRITPMRVFGAVLEDGTARGELVMHDQGGRSMPMDLHRHGSSAWETFVVEREAMRAGREAALETVRPPPLVETTRGPATGRVDSAALDHLVDAASRSHTSALVILLDGEVVGEWYSGGSSRRIETMSITKSVVSLAVGRLLELGLLESIDVPVHAFFPEWAEGDYARITVRHLLTHTSGLESPMPTTPIYASEDFVQFALDAPVVAEPGTTIEYNNNATNLLAGLIGRAAGQRMDRFLADELFAPLGIHDFGWSLDLAGNPHGMAGLQMHARDLARLGQLVLQGGRWNGERLIAEEWIEASTRPATTHARSVGFLWWLVAEDERLVGVRADGYLGQYLMLYPDQGLVGVRLIAGFPGYDAERDGFGQFPDLLRRLVP